MIEHDMLCFIKLYVDDENKDYTVDYTYHSDETRFHSETTAIFDSGKEAMECVQGITKRNRESRIPTEINVEVL